MKASQAIDTAVTAIPQAIPQARVRGEWSVFASVKLTVLLLSMIAASVLLGAWCPQEAQVGQEKVIEQFGPDLAVWMIKLGIADIFHTPFFLTLIALLTINLVVASWQRVFPRLLVLRHPLPFLKSDAVERLPKSAAITLPVSGMIALDAASSRLRQNLYFVRREGNALVAESGKFGRLAPSVTHVGLLTLLLGVTISSWTGFSGFKPVPLHDALQFADSQHSHLWIGKLPNWHVRVDATRRENYPNGDAQQWFSNLTVLDQHNHTLTRSEISVNNPLSYDGVDIYQSSWALDHILLSFNGKEQNLGLRQMGKVYASFLPLTSDLILIFSVRDQAAPLRIFAKRPDWQAPKLLGEVAAGQELHMGSVVLKYNGVIPVTGLQYKSDPGLSVTYTAFAFILVGVCLASIPHRQVWAAVEPGENGSSELFIGGHSKKATIIFQRQIDKISEQIARELKGAIASAPHARSTS